MDDDIVISGIAGRYPECEDVEEFWYKLMNAIPMYTADDRRWPVELLDLPKLTGKLKSIEKFDAGFFNLTDNEANQMDPQMRIFHETTYEAIFDAGIDPSTLRDSATSVYLGSCYNDASVAKFEDVTSTPQNLDFGPSEISKSFGFNGTTVLIDTACASSFSALHEAVQAIKMNICDQAVVGGIALHLRPNLATGFRNLKMLSPDGKCKCLDAKADGYCRSEAVVSMFIQRRKTANRIYATILHSKTNADGYKTEGITFPSRDAQYKLMKECYAEAKIDPEKSINYVEAHITGTPVGDPIECGAILAALRPNRKKPIKFGCLRSNIGHTEGGSALCSITKVALALQRREVPPNINFETPNPNIEELNCGLIQPVIEPTKLNEDIVAVNSFGFGGVNVHAILKANEKISLPNDYDWVFDNSINRLVNLNNRTIDGLNYTVDYITNNRSKISNDYLGLVNKVSKMEVSTGLDARGFAILSNDGKVIEKRVGIIDEKRPVWYVFNGLGSQWPGMAKRLLVFDAFKESIEKMAKVLKKYDVDLIHLLTEAGNEVFEKNLSNVLVCITSTQIGLVDLLNWLDLKPDGIFGHSVGEYGAAYAAGSATAEQIIELVYHLGKCNNELHKSKGAMASIGLDWNEAVKICSKTNGKVYAACDNIDSNVTISGDYNEVQKIGEELSKKDIFFKNVFCCEMAFHCPVANVSYEATLAEFKKVLTKPLKRNPKWVSTSVKQEKLEDPNFSHFTAEYCSNNMVSPVYFREALNKIPKNATIIEFGPHSQLLPLIKRQLGSNSICVPLTKRNVDNEFDNANVLLSGLGQIYQTGNSLSIEKLYPKVEFPVARETLSICHLIKWNHEKNHFVARFPNYFNFLTPTVKHKVDLVDPNQKFYVGHCIDGRILFPATGYLYVVWLQLARMNKKINLNELPVEFHNVNLQRAVIIPKNGSVSLQITLMDQSGEFTISESGSICCSGRINFIHNNELNIKHNRVQRFPDQDAITLKEKDIYKELRIRGYDYTGLFQGVVEASSDGSLGKVKWNGNWVTFTDCMLQLAILGNPMSRTLHLPTFIEYVRFDTKYLINHAEQLRKEHGESVFEVSYDKFANIGMTKGIIIKGLKASPAPRRQNVQSAKIEYYNFTPYVKNIPEQVKLDKKDKDYLDLCMNLLEEKVELDSEKLKNFVEDREENGAALFFKDRLLSKINNEDYDFYQQLLMNDEKLTKDKLIKIDFYKVLKDQLSTVIENHFSRQIKIVEVNCTSGIISQDVEEIMQSYNLSTNYNIMQETAGSTLQPAFVEKIIEFSSELNTLPSSLDKVQFMIFADWSLSFLSKLETKEFDYKVFLKSSFDSLVNGAFLIFTYRSKYTSYELEVAKKIEDFCQVKKDLPEKEKFEKLLTDIGFVQIGFDFDEITNIGSILVRKPNNVEIKCEDNIVIEVENQTYDWVDNLKAAVKSKAKRVWLIADNKPTNGLIGMANCLKREPGGDRIRCVFNISGSKFELTDEIKAKDLFFNIFKKNNVYGSYRHYNLDLQQSKVVNDAYVDIITRGDLSSLKWLELDTSWKKDSNTKAVRVNYAALNFKDVMVATGRVPLSAYPSGKDYCAIGMEYSGTDLQTGKKVFGFTNCAAISSQLNVANDSCCIEVPDIWTLPEAATISVVYETVYYSLFIRGNLLPGESILIHAGSGGIGQAAISVCLRKGCEVFTTVGTEEKKKFILERFPLLKEENIFNSRSIKFEEEILKATNGQGVNMILNSLAEEKLRSSVNCLSEFGRFIEIGKYDMVVNNPMDMMQFTNNKTFSVVCLAHLQDDALNNKSPSAIKIIQRLREMIRLGIQNGEVVPLPYTIFKHNEVEQAFRYMANGKHIGKVLIQVQDENEPVHLYKAYTQSFFDSEKSYIITGGLGGFGLELANWLVEKGAAKLVLSSRNGVKTSYQELSIQRLIKKGVTVQISKNHATTYESAANLIEEAMNLGPVGGIFNLAMVLKDSILENQSVESFKIVCEPKVNTTTYLDKLSRKLCPEIDYFVCFSSVAAGIGNPGQTNYGFANSSMERICELRREEGLHGLAVQWGAIGDVGVVAEQFGNDVNLGGTVPQRIPFCLEVLNKFICSDHAVCSSIVLSAAKKTIGKDKNDLVRTICHVIGIKDFNSLDPNTTLLDLGLDSLMAVEIKQGLEREYETNLTTQEIRQLTIRDLQEIGARKQVIQISNKKDSSDVSALTINNILTTTPTKLFIKLNAVEEKDPIFFLPPIEADFKLMSLLVEHLNRPVIGVTWTEEVSRLNTIKEVANYIADNLISAYSLTSYDLVGYSFGTAVAFEVSACLQERLGKQAVSKMIFLDGAPTQLRLQTEHLIKTTESYDEGTGFAEVTITFVSIFHEIEHIDLVREKLRELKTKKEKTEMIAEYLSSKLHVNVDPVLLEKALDSYMSKIKMLYLYNPTHKFNGTIKLIKASEKGIMWVDQVNDEDYGISKLLNKDSTYEVMQIQGDHRSFITNNSREIGTYIDSILDYIPC